MGMRCNNNQQLTMDDSVLNNLTQLLITDSQLQTIMQLLLDNLKRGLSKNTHLQSITKCFVTYVQNLPDGTEKGKYLALDLGGTNFRVLLIELDGTHSEMKSKIYAIPNSIMVGTGIQLFDHIAECLANFMKEHGVVDERLALGFTFSFPLTQKGLTKGILARWTKGFNCSDCVGHDVVQLLREALARRNDVKIDICAILNDTTGTLMSCSWKKHDCRVGLIVGTGSNACYVEKLENAEMFDGERDTNTPYVVINTEWGAFGDDGCLDFIRTEYDRDIDNNSINTGKQLYEKMISGMYMGELVRLILVQLTNKSLLFRGRGSDLLFERGQFFTKYVSEIESDPPGVYTNCLQVLQELGLSDCTPEDCHIVRHVCEQVSSRAAHLVAAGIATLINKMDINPVSVAVDGSVFRFHPRFRKLMENKIKTLINDRIKFELMLSEDGSGRGAALVAAVACRMGR